MFTEVLRRMVSFDKAVYWPPGAGPDNYGKERVGTAVEIDCRWEDVKISYIDRSGRILTSSAIIFSLTDLNFGGMLWHGRLAACDTSNPQNNVGALEIRQLKKMSNLYNEITLCQATI